MIIAFFSRSSLYPVLYPSITSFSHRHQTPPNISVTFLFFPPSFPHLNENDIANCGDTMKDHQKSRRPTESRLSVRRRKKWKKVRISRDLTVVDEGSKEQVRMAKPRIPRNHATNGYEKRQRAHAYRELLFGNVRVRVPSTSRRVDRVPRWYHLVEGKVEHRDRPPRTKWRFSRAFNSAYHGPPTSFLRCFDRPLIVRLPNHLSLSLSFSFFS